MALADILIPRTEIKVGENSFHVRGLCADDIIFALVTDQEGVEKAVDLFKAGDFENPQHQIKFISTFAVQIPALAAQLVACASDEPDQAEKVARLPFPKQVEALQAIAELTLVEPDSLKKLLGHATAIMNRFAQTKK